MRLHFISGLPRSGSTLLAAILRQNPNTHAAMTSPLSDIFASTLRVMSISETALFLSDEQRERILRAVVHAYCCGFSYDVLYDTSRVWTAYAAPLLSLFPDARLICCVRNPAWIVDSIERLVQKNAFLVSRLFGPDTTNVYGRAETLMKGGLLGTALHSLRQAWFGPHSGRVIAVQYESLAARPREVLGALYQLLAEQPFEHRFDDLEFDEPEFDMRLNMPGLHRVSRQVQLVERRTILPPDLFAQFDNAFWTVPAHNPDGPIVL